MLPPPTPGSTGSKIDGDVITVLRCQAATKDESTAADRAPNGASSGAFERASDDASGEAADTTPDDSATDGDLVGINGARDAGIDGAFDAVSTSMTVSSIGARGKGDQGPGSSTGTRYQTKRSDKSTAADTAPNEVSGGAFETASDGAPGQAADYSRDGRATVEDTKCIDGTIDAGTDGAFDAVSHLMLIHGVGGEPEGSDAISNASSVSVACTIKSCGSRGVCGLVSDSCACALNDALVEFSHLQRPERRREPSPTASLPEYPSSASLDGVWKLIQGPTSRFAKECFQSLRIDCGAVLLGDGSSTTLRWRRTGGVFLGGGLLLLEGDVLVRQGRTGFPLRFRRDDT